MNPDRVPDERVYEEVESLDAFYSVVEQWLDEYNNTSKNRMNLVVFWFVCIQYISSIERCRV